MKGRATSSSVTAWAQLGARSLAARETGLSGMFSSDSTRPDAMLLTGPHLGLDVSLQFVTSEMLSLIEGALVESGVSRMRSAMLAGEIVNPTEGRPAVHATGRAGASGAVGPMLEMARALRDGRIAPAGERIETVVNLGIGGSHLGPAMAVRALESAADGPEVRFVSNVDPAALERALIGVDLSRTVFVVSSKTFTTPETLANAARARARLDAAGSDPARHFVAVTAAPDRARQWGITSEQILDYPEGIGGRFSLSGPTGLPVAVAIGPERFVRMLDAMAEMDRHFAEAPARSNLPVVHAVLTTLGATVLDYRSLAVVAYCDRLELFTAYLQQLMMESNGKSVQVSGEPVRASGPAVWGGVGTNGQHAYFQWLHQGTDPTPVDFVIVGADPAASADAEDRAATQMLVANALAQGEVLAFGGAATDAPGTADDPHRRLPGNRPSTRILLRELSPETLGALVAFYEHSTVVQAWLMGVNPFDQFGVEHGKAAARVIQTAQPRDGAQGSQGRWAAAARWLTRT